MKTLLRILLILIPFLWSIIVLAQPKEKDCSTNCFSTSLISVEKLSSTCSIYKMEVSHNGDCRFALSHFTVAVPCGQVSEISNSQNWKQEVGVDPTSGLSGFKIDDISDFGEDALSKFTVSFKLCSDNTSCQTQMACWNPVVAYKASTCVHLDTVQATCQNLEATLNIQNVSCFGAADGELSVDIAAGQEPFTYAWSNGRTTSSISGLDPGTYSVEITDASGASVTLEGEVLSPSEIVVASEIIKPACSGIGNGSIALTVAGGSGEYAFIWSNGETTAYIDSLANGNYSVIVSDSAGCGVTESYSLAATSSLIVGITPTSPNCNRSDGALSLSVSGGTEPYSYSWSNGGQTPQIDDLSPGFYSVLVIDASGCSLQASYNLKDNNTLKLTATITPTGCNNDATGAIDITVSGGTAPYTFTWDGRNDVPEDLGGLTSGFYTVTVTDASGCTKTLRVFVPRKTFTVSSLVTQPTCEEGSTGTVTLGEPSGGVEPYTYVWSNGETSSTITGLIPGTYWVIITDATGCTRQLYFVIQQPGAITATATVSNDLCNRESFFDVDLSVTGGTGPYSYAWSNGATSEDLVDVGSGTYTVVVTDASGCSMTKEIVIAPSADVWECLINALSTSPVCGSEGNTLSTSMADADSFRWSVSSSDGQWQISGDTTAAQIEFIAGGENSSAVFTLTIIKGGCSQTCSINVSACEPVEGTDPGGEDPGGEEPGGEDPDEGSNDESCEECFDSSIKIVDTNGSCITYEAEINTTGNCRHDLSHWTLSIACGIVSNVWNSENWKVETGTDPTTGLSGLKIDDINEFGKTSGSFKVGFTVCYSSSCGDPSEWIPVAAYKAGQCVSYDTLSVEENHTLAIAAYPNPFHSEMTFEWTSDRDEKNTLEVLDQFGLRVAIVFDGNVEAGQVNNYKWSAGSAPTGLYYYKLVSGGKTTTGKIFHQ